MDVDHEEYILKEGEYIAKAKEIFADVMK